MASARLSTRTAQRRHNAILVFAKGDIPVAAGMGVRTSPAGARRISPRLSRAWCSRRGLELSSRTVCWWPSRRDPQRFKTPERRAPEPRAKAEASWPKDALEPGRAGVNTRSKLAAWQKTGRMLALSIANVIRHLCSKKVPGVAVLL